MDQPVSADEDMEVEIRDRLSEGTKMMGNLGCLRIRGLSIVGKIGLLESMVVSSVSVS